MRYLTARCAALVVLSAIAMLEAGCLVKETTATLSLNPDGSVHWSVLERNIHATGDTPADRERQEREFMALAEAGTSPAAEALRAAGGSNVSSRTVSAVWPFAVLTEGDFSDIARLTTECLKRGGISAHSTLSRNGERNTWNVDIDLTDASTDADAESPSVADVLLDERTPLFLRHGQFTEAVGFDITDDGRVARLEDLSKHDWDKEPRLHLSLTWTTLDTERGR